MVKTDSKAITVTFFDWTAVKRRVSGPHKDISFDVWQWNLFKMKWVRLSHTACGFAYKKDADACAKRLSDEIARMLASNRAPPPPPA